MEQHLKLSDFAFKQAIIIAYEEAEGLEPFEDIDNTIDSATEGLNWIGFSEDDESL